MLKVVGASWMKIRMSTWIIGIVLVLGVIVVILGQLGELEEDGNYSASAYWNEETGFEIRFWGQGLTLEKVPTGVARAYFQPHIDTTGWAIIDIETQSNYPDWVQAYAAGMLEGSLSWQLIYWHWKNTVQNICENQKLFCNYIRTYLEENFKSVKSIYENTDDPYWHQVYLFYMQLEGMKQGFEHGVKRSRQTIEELQLSDFLWLNAASDVVDLEYKFYDSKPYTRGLYHSDVKNFYTDSVVLQKLHDFRSVEGYSNDSEGQEEEKRSFIGCGASLGSTLVKLVPENGSLFVGHDTAAPYVSMLRMIKKYHFRFHWSPTNFWMVENKLTFSSYPGAVHSMDDFYVISLSDKGPQLVVAGTPITVFTRSLWKLVSPREQVLSGVRTIVASRLSSNASTWVKHMSRHNSGTGNKQWVVVDIEKFRNVTRKKGGHEKPYASRMNDVKDVLWVAEQIPGLFFTEDQTDLLRTKTYWASYGLPFYQNVSEMSGVNDIRETFGDAFSYENSPLAKIYRRDHDKARTIDATLSLMRSNSYRKDPYSMGNPRCAIGARGDIPTEVSYSFPIGVIDSKVFSFGLGGNETNSTAENPSVFRAVAGPAHSLRSVPETQNRTEEATDQNVTLPFEPETNDDLLKPFNWAESIFAGFPHNGHPDIWDFDPINLSL